jgi:hypothetical protein
MLFFTQSIICAGAALFWLHVIPRVLCTIFILFGPVWVFSAGAIVELLLVPFVVLTGLPSAVDIFSLIDIGTFPASAVFAYLVILSGIYVSIQAVDAVDIGPDSRKIL